MKPSAVKLKVAGSSSLGVREILRDGRDNKYIYSIILIEIVGHLLKTKRLCHLQFIALEATSNPAEI